MLNEHDLIENMKCQIGFRPCYNQSICEVLNVIRWILGLSDNLPFEIKGINRSKEVAVFVTSSISFRESETLAENGAVPLSGVFPSAEYPSLWSLFLELPPSSHGFFSKEIFMHDRSVDLDTLRISRKERHIWRHSKRFGKFRERLAGFKNYFYIKRLLGAFALFRNFGKTDIRIYWGSRRYPRIFKLTGLDRYFVKAASLSEVMSILSKRKKETNKKVDFVLLDSFSSPKNFFNTKSAAEILKFFNGINIKDAVMLLISINGNHRSEISIPFTQGEIKYFQGKGLYLCLDNRVGFIHGKIDDTSLAILEGKLKKRADLYSVSYLQKMGFFDRGGNMGNMIILPKDNCTLGYEEIPAMVSCGGITKEEMIVPLIIRNG